MEDLAQLHPAAQVALILAVGTFACVAVWQFLKTVREM